MQKPSLMILTFVLMMVATLFNGCSQKVYIKPNYPKLEAIKKVPKIDIIIVDGLMDRNDTLKAFKTIKSLRVSERYYYRLISDYRERFTNEKK